MMQQMLPDLLNILGPLLVAAITYYTADWLLAYKAWSDASSPNVKRAVVLAVAGLITVIAKLIAVELPTDLALWDPNTIDTLVSATLAMSIKAGNTAKDAKAEARDTALEVQEAKEITHSLRPL